MTISYYPRITDAYAMTLISEYSQFEDPSALTQNAATHSPMEFHDSVATEKVSPTSLKKLREEILAAAQESAFPNPLGLQKVRDFDQKAAAILYDHMDLIPAEAANQEIWNFLTMILLPDIAAWRYPNRAKKPAFERWLGVDRNVFRKLWWREATLGRALNSKLGEDEAVGIMERPGLSGNPALARAIVREFDLQYREYGDFSRSDLMRAVMVNIRRHVPLLDFEFYTETELEALIAEIVEEACSIYAASKSQTINSNKGNE
ncbi:MULTISPECIES: hypothetical protein [Corynebacterium]|uniref:hypothetical protein n=1 Tax=Corynebacterium TaxID=1716 RepID=UPI00257B8D26|nr:MULTISPECIES: hypothetical protein [Corynebacterium]